jgi:hypothetical protein
MKAIQNSLLFLFLSLNGNQVQAQGFLYLPLKDKTVITCDFECCNFYQACNHQAIDWDTTDNQTKVYSAAEGEVIKVVQNWQDTSACHQKGGQYGNYILIRHPNNYTTLYAHLKYGTIKVKVGDKVSAGQEIAIADNTGCSTGSHLHFEVRDPSGKKVNPYGNPPDYQSGCGLNPLWATCPPLPYEPSLTDQDQDGYPIAEGDCDDSDPSINPAADELCDGKDNDCDGETDENWPEKNSKCSKGAGECFSEGQWVCAQDKKSLFCSARTISPQPEKCDGKDNDCDGETDEDWKKGLASDLGKPCTVGVGECRNTGVMICTPDGKATVCSAEPKPSSQEICDKKDNDCDGATDEDFPFLGEPCTVGIGECQNSGVILCSPDGLTEVCSAKPKSSSPELCDGKDNDCDGLTDEGFNLGAPCTVGVGECQVTGVIVCATDLGKAVCSKAPLLPQPEICDGKDNNCNGETDEEPEASLSCTTPPQNFCLNQTTLRVYSSSGFCSQSICTYNFIDTQCSYGCKEAECQSCTPNCQYKECGNDGCGGSCGNCGIDLECVYGQCKVAGKIVYVDEVGTSSKIYIINAYGGPSQFLTEGEAPIWFPDNSRIAFIKSIYPDFQVGTIKPDGTDEVIINFGHWEIDDKIAWSPDMTQLVAPVLDGGWLDTIGYTTDLYLFNITNGSVQQLTSGKFDDRYPSWSPDNSKIAFARAAVNIWDRRLCIINSDGSSLEELIAAPKLGLVSWSPDGNSIAFVREYLTLNIFDLHTQSIKCYGSAYCDIVWSPDSKKIAVGDYTITNGRYYCVIQIESAETCEYLMGPGIAYKTNYASPRWSPHGKYLGYLENGWLIIEGPNDLPPIWTNAFDWSH